MTRSLSIAHARDLAPGSRKLAFVEGRSVVLFNIEGVMHAIDNACPHNGASLANGRLDGHVLQCPAHGLRFDLVSGCMVGAPDVCLTKLSVEAIDGEKGEKD
ncbi:MULTISPECIES: Rieske 2Fe-2S domain-containing protein [unclassified Caballeronia]|uniref:Rieske (2Fe-2S) protein n=1 Tax=unclassified Caballeronia TaxID=2646786 RepID=UPI00286181B7|nr:MULTISPECIES: Rieske 2Fe-2S domain-containing protein [unclassified Caballeronia]MDR5741008.1 Rieske 2Fe-2S domain-containing protein [Caballeronia sp. LZ016]MDR5806907.1 Rieske 2Fe-2S domain-containing protein [Caballeronia sp. LZ019]